MTERVGIPSTSGEDAERFLRDAFNPLTGELTIPLVGRIGEAIRTAHAGGARGKGRIIAIADIGFDPAWSAVRGRHAASVIADYFPDPERGPHGTIVALLAHAAAPEAELLLYDVEVNRLFGVDKTADAITDAATAGAAVVNVSGEFPTDCAPRDTSWLDVSVMLDLDPDPDLFSEQVAGWIAWSEPYSGARCSWECAICDAVGASGHPVVVAAAGNILETACPACVETAVGVGFQSRRSVVIDGNIVLANGVPVTRHGNDTRPEIMLHEPPGFNGTSFAAPLLVGLTALLPAPGDLGQMARLGHAATPLLELANRHRVAGNAVPPRAVNTLLDGMEQFRAKIPSEHQHWRDPSPRPCALCALVLADWWDTFVAYRLHLAWGTIGPGRSEESGETVLRLACTVAAIAPFSAASAAHEGLAWELHANATAGPEREEALLRARDALTRAIGLSDEDSAAVHAAARARVVAAAAESA